MNTQQPTALRLADALEAGSPTTAECDAAAAELRRLHEENTQLRTQYDGLLAASVARIAALAQALTQAVEALENATPDYLKAVSCSRADKAHMNALATARQTLGGKHD